MVRRLLLHSRTELLTPSALLSYWETRAQQYGSRAVLNLGHGAEEFDEITRGQRDMLLPLLASVLKPSDKEILDYGCGPGRFSVDLAQLSEGRVTAIDPIQQFLSAAPRNPRVNYEKMVPPGIPCAAESFDAVWICLVLGGITDPDHLRASITEIRRVLKPGGLLFLVENTSALQPGPTWTFRPVQEYLRQFDFCDLRVIGSYFDRAEEITVMAGRVKGSGPL